MDQGLVTVVLPIYNVEQYLNRCIESVVNQTYKNLEIILVDDGSTDHCPEICDRWAEIDKRIRVIHKVNAGLGMARNTGIENATGEYICFFDSDDYAALHTIERTYTLAKKSRAEVVVFGSSYQTKEGTISEINIPNPDKMLYEGEEIQTEFLPDLIGPDISTGKETKLLISACCCIYSMRLIRDANWQFVSEREIISEDIYSLLNLYKSVKKVAVLPEALYFYCENLSSLSHTYKADRYEKNKYFYEACLKACDELGYCQKVKDRLSYPFISNTIAAIKIIVRADCRHEEKKCAVDAILKDQYFYNVISGMDLKHEKWTRKALLLAIKYRLYGLARLMVIVKA